MRRTNRHKGSVLRRNIGGFTSLQILRHDPSTNDDSGSYVQRRPIGGFQMNRTSDNHNHNHNFSGAASTTTNASDIHRTFQRPPIGGWTRVGDHNNNHEAASKENVQQQEQPPGFRATRTKSDDNDNRGNHSRVLFGFLSRRFQNNSGDSNHFKLGASKRRRRMENDSGDKHRKRRRLLFEHKNHQTADDAMIVDEFSDPYISTTCGAKIAEC